MSNMKQTPKFLTIRLRYTDELDFIKGMEQIRKEIMSHQTNNSSGRLGDVSYDWHYVFAGFDDWREEEINGVWYRIYQSKMNKDE